MPYKKQKTDEELMNQMLDMVAARDALTPLTATKTAELTKAMLKPGRITPNTTGTAIGSINLGTGVPTLGIEDTRQITKTLVKMKYGPTIYEFVIDWKRMSFSSNGISISHINTILIQGGGYGCNCQRLGLIQQFYKGNLLIPSKISHKEQPGIELLEHKNIKT